MATKTLLAATLAVTTLLTACAAPSQPFLDDMQIGCKNGKQNDCAMIPHLQAQVNAEKAEQAGNVALGILGGLALVAGAAAAGYSAAHPVYSPPVVVVCRWNCW